MEVKNSLNILDDPELEIDLKKAIRFLLEKMAMSQNVIYKEYMGGTTVSDIRPFDFGNWLRENDLVKED